MHDKSQAVRALDILLLGPFMVYAGARESTLPVWMRVGLVGSGILTVTYNAKNFSKTRELEKTTERLEHAELVMGTIYEMQHTDDFDSAKRIAVERLSRDPLFYSRLQDAET